MSGCLDNVQCPQWECCEGMREKRNIVASIIAGSLFAAGWWFAIDAAAVFHKADMHPAVHVCGVFSTLALVMINSVSNGQVHGDSYNEGCLGQRGARVWLFLGFLLGFAALIAAAWVLFGIYVVPKKDPELPGIFIFLQNALIFFSALIFKFGRTEELWG